MSSYVIAIDQSTSGTKAILVNQDGHVVGKCSRSHDQCYPQQGWVEHDPEQIYDNLCIVLKELLAASKVKRKEIIGLALCNQRETSVVWSATDGRPVYPAIVWQCQRTRQVCERLAAEGAEDEVRQSTGLVLDPYFSATKIQWILSHVSITCANQTDLRVGTMDSWLLWKLTGGRVHATDISNASRTLLFNIHTLEWDERLCRLFGVPMDLLPEVRASSDFYGTVVDEATGLKGVPILAVMGDSQASSFGHLCVRPGQTKVTFGTGTSVLMNIGNEVTISADRGVLTSIGWKVGNRVTYVAEAAIRSTGDTIQWLRNELRIIDTEIELLDALKEEQRKSDVYFVPAFTGLGSPYWVSSARAAILGIDRSTTRTDILRAAVESIAFQVRDAKDLLERELGTSISEIRADGGASRNRHLMQLQADVLNIPVQCSKEDDMSALGVAYAAGLRAGLWGSVEELANDIFLYQLYTPNPEKHRECECRYLNWRNAVDAVLGYSTIMKARRPET
ncbi:FGGY-family carbohydrate kinase [Alicyclobacillus vulcanalis]|uniref:ATP:glycerol 3-phosphotransferase n=1 Tax=Alicyclobacillus vulcanalis TaxID=252246 RepID=A0A1N7PGH6_9BACL|nr:glycerol kinase GlpK [Alicyclobacillus vulcanalis]SIT09678.1 glycerol kinase [Alicyclobacillus vulcanalis]